MDRPSEPSQQDFRDTSQSNHPMSWGRRWGTNPSSHDTELLRQDGAWCSGRTSGEKKISVMCLSKSKGPKEVNVGQSQKCEYTDVADLFQRLSSGAGI